MSHLFYKAVGALYIVLALPSLGVWVWSSAFPEANNFFTFSIGGVPLGLMLFLFGTGRASTNKFSAAALKIAIVGLVGYLPFAVTYALLSAGADTFASSLVLSIFFITFATVVAFIFAVFGTLHGKKKDGPARLASKHTSRR